MLRKLNFYHIFLGCFFFSTFYYALMSNAIAEDFSKVELKKELRRGNFLIGLKQYLGGKNDQFSENSKITFTSDKGFLNLHSSNGIKYKSKKINIKWREIPRQAPYFQKRFVFGPYASYESAKQQAQNLQEKGFEAIVAYPNNWEVWAPYSKNLPEDIFKYKIFKKFYKTQITPFLSNENTSLKLQGPIYLSSDEEIRINNINFGKKFFLIKDLYGTWTLIQKINFDDYLRGVLPHEIGSNVPLEALKAQAVIARTWGIYNSERFSMDKYHLCVTTQCQVYKPSSITNKKINKAIQETSNLILTYRNKPINSFYHASNGGMTSRASESWKTEDISYFKAKIDGSQSLNKSLKIPIRNKVDLEKFLDFKKTEFYGNDHRLFRWNKKIPKLDIKEILIRNKLINENDNFLDIYASERGASGRVTKLVIRMNNPKKSIFLVKDDIRRIMRFLPSNLFTINKLNDNLWLFKGGGFGHGVGLSQSGAIEMAKLGFTYEQILNHYYEGTKLKKIEKLSQW